MSKDDDDDDDDDVAKRKTNVQTRVSDAVLSKFIHFLGFLKRLPSKENPRGCLADICFKNKDTTHLKVTLVTFVSVFIFLPCRWQGITVTWEGNNQKVRRNYVLNE